MKSPAKATDCAAGEAKEKVTFCLGLVWVAICYAGSFRLRDPLTLLGHCVPPAEASSTENPDCDGANTDSLWRLTGVTSAINNRYFS